MMQQMRKSTASAAPTIGPVVSLSLSSSSSPLLFSFGPPVGLVLEPGLVAVLSMDSAFAVAVAVAVTAASGAAGARLGGVVAVVVATVASSAPAVVVVVVVAEAAGVAGNAVGVGGVLSGTAGLGVGGGCVGGGVDGGVGTPSHVPGLAPTRRCPVPQTMFGMVAHWNPLVVPLQRPSCCKPVPQAMLSHARHVPGLAPTRYWLVEQAMFALSTH